MDNRRNEHLYILTEMKQLTNHTGADVRVFRFG